MSLWANPRNELTVRDSDKGFSDSWPYSVINLFTDQVVLYYMKGSVVRCLVSVI